jgi:putative CocE/NonD family hydrolase
VYTTDALRQDVEVTGPVSMTLYAASSGTDTDWIARLIDVFPDGRAYNVTSGGIRARYRRSPTKPVPLTPGVVEKYDVDLWATSNLFKKGHRIRVEIASSDFPAVDRNPNVAIDLTRVTPIDYRLARQVIYHDALRPSSIELPIIPRTRAREWISRPSFAPTSGQYYLQQTPAPPSPPARELPASDLSS